MKKQRILQHIEFTGVEMKIAVKNFIEDKLQDDDEIIISDWGNGDKKILRNRISKPVVFSTEKEPVRGGRFIINFSKEKTFYNNKKLESVMFNLGDKSYKISADDLKKYENPN